MMIVFMIHRYQNVRPQSGKCPEGFNMNEDGQCYPDKPCPPGYARADNDESGACLPFPHTPHQEGTAILHTQISV